MNSSYKLLIAFLGVGLLLSAATLVLPDSGARAWVRFAQPGLLFLSAILAGLNAPSYRSDLRRVFIFLAGFLLLYGLVNVEPLDDLVFEQIEGAYLRFLFIYQLITYSLLLAACVFVVRAVVLARRSLYAIAGALLALAVGVAVVWNAVPVYHDLNAINSDAANSYLVIRGLDALASVALVPVVALYLESTRRAKGESASFATAMAGVVFGLIAVYLYELTTGQSLIEIATAEAMTGSLLDAIYVLGYSTVAAGLGAHLLHHRFSFHDLDAMLVRVP